MGGGEPLTASGIFSSRRYQLTKQRQAPGQSDKLGQPTTFDGPGEYLVGVQQAEGQEGSGLMVLATRGLVLHPTGRLSPGGENGQFDPPVGSTSDHLLR